MWKRGKETRGWHRRNGLQCLLPNSWQTSWLRAEVEQVALLLTERQTEKETQEETQTQTEEQEEEAEIAREKRWKADKTDGR